MLTDSGDQVVTGHAELSDATLVEQTRAGDQKAFGELWRRHYPSALAAARATTSKFDPDDLAQESFAAILSAIKRGGGPKSGFRAYLLTAVRNTAAGWGRSSREYADDQLDTHIDPDWSEAQTEDELDRSLTATAFRSLPTRWQEVLWYTEIEEMKPTAVAPLLGMKPLAVSQLAFRAREGLREAWIQAHLRSLSDDSECKWVVERLGAYARKNSSRRDTMRIDAHLLECARCMIVFDEASNVSGRLAMVLLPLALGAVGASGYLAQLRGTPLSEAAAAGTGDAFPTAITRSTKAATGTVSKVGLSAAAATLALALAGGVTVLALTQQSTLVQTFGEGALESAAPSTELAATPTPEPELSPASEPEPEPAPEPRSGEREQAPAPPRQPPAPPLAPSVPSSTPAPTTPAPADPGTEPGTDPGTEPGTDPGTEPGTDPGTEPGTDPGTEPVDELPTDYPVVNGYAVSAPGDPAVLDLLIVVPEGLLAQVGFEGEEPQVAGPDEFGTATFTFHPSVEQLSEDISIVMVFLNEAGTGPSVAIPLSSFFTV